MVRKIALMVIMNLMKQAINDMAPVVALEAMVLVLI